MDAPTDKVSFWADIQSSIIKKESEKKKDFVSYWRTHGHSEL